MKAGTALIIYLTIAIITFGGIAANKKDDCAGRNWGKSNCQFGSAIAGGAFWPATLSYITWDAIVNREPSREIICHGSMVCQVNGEWETCVCGE